MLAQQQVDFSATLAALTAALVVAGPVAVGVTKLVDFVRNLIDKDGSISASQPWVWNALAFVLGIAIALGWGVNVFGAVVATIPALAESDVLAGTGGTILTGMFIGAMAGFWHDKMAQWSASRQADRYVYTGTQPAPKPSGNRTTAG